MPKENPIIIEVHGDGSEVQAGFPLPEVIVLRIIDGNNGDTLHAALTFNQAKSLVAFMNKCLDGKIPLMTDD